MIAKQQNQTKKNGDFVTLDYFLAIILMTSALP
jgi:hypothetical protein